MSLACRTKGGQAAVSIICEVDHLTLVYGCLAKSSYTNLDPIPYIMECDLDAYTMADKQATDKWELHPILQRRRDDGVPLSSPFGIIVTARQKKGACTHTCRHAHTHAHIHTHEYAKYT
jgi:hypothetical protein